MRAVIAFIAATSLALVAGCDKRAEKPAPATTTSAALAGGTVDVPVDRDGSFVGGFHDVMKEGTVIDGPVTIAVAPDGSAVMTFTMQAHLSTRAVGVAVVRTPGKLTGMLIGTTFSATGTLKTGTVTATGRLEGDTINGTIQGGKDAPIHFQAARSLRQ